jgi:methylaspartate mutase epsilon subunit
VNSHFSTFIRRSRDAGLLVVQPRMGFGTVIDMRLGLSAVAKLEFPVIGTLTLDSYTRVGDYRTPQVCLDKGEKLNGYPIVTHSVTATRNMLEGLFGPNFPVQVRHGTALPQNVFRRLVEIGLDASEGGPVSYCLPYSKIPLSKAIQAWAESCHILGDGSECAHIESFGGCLLGQLCPPSILIAIALLECLFFHQHGVHSVSISYAQGTSLMQDRGAIAALRELAGQYLSDLDWHVVLYTYMGVFPSSFEGATSLIQDSAQLGKETACERMIVKTPQEARQIPSVDDNIYSLRLASTTANNIHSIRILSSQEAAYRDEIFLEAKTLIDEVLSLNADIGKCLLLAFNKGLLDIPYCLHMDNAGRTSAYIDPDGALRWARSGSVPLPPNLRYLRRRQNDVSSSELLNLLNYVANKYDGITC